MAGTEYAGEHGISRACQEAVMAMIQFGRRIASARILTTFTKHALLLTDEHKNLIAIKSGFSSGYQGEGPRRFSYVLQLLDSHSIPIQEFVVNGSFMERLENSSLTRDDISELEKTRPVENGAWRDYVLEKHLNESLDGSLWNEFPPIIPFAIIDGRIMDLAISFWDAPDEKLMTAYRRLEDILRKKIGSQDCGINLFSKAFHVEKPMLTWEGLAAAEREGRLSLFRGVYMTYRNPRAHKDTRHTAKHYLAEFLLLNNLYILERESVHSRPA